ncbi:MAG: NAD(P)-dependent oxidoreductase, partial [Bacteroidota bacterium]|nr:NAD(P)-dependent oxidoreductase [Bacteroidota bacterium]MDX5429630.1 NAD(P)-dependent oxidoreductase [Bacteroidota bacterium]MDX5468414.1 NAD(P)-dependent oxidoreductase [Bacteroidota bacterium]
MAIKKHILVLGASGFIGKEVVKSLLNRKDIGTISVIQHRQRPVESDRIHYFQGAIQSFNWSQLDANPPDHILHLARLNATRWGALGRRWSAEKGKRANQRLLRHLQKSGWTSRISYISGSLMYGDLGESVATEHHPLRPTSFAKEYIHAELPFVKDEGSQLIRLPWVFGNASWFEAFYLRPMKEKGKVPCYGNGQNQMSFIEVGDAGKLIVEHALHTPEKVVNLSMEPTISQLEFCQNLAAVSHLPLELQSNERLERQYPKAIVEAFTSSIALSSIHQQVFTEKATYQNPVTMLKTLLPSFLN